jgi:hypothetical protein
MTKPAKIGYIVGGTLGVLVLAAYGALVYVVTTPGSPGHCEAILRFFGTSDCSVVVEVDTSGWIYVVLIAVVLTLAGGGIGKLLSRQPRQEQP